MRGFSGECAWAGDLCREVALVQARSEFNLAESVPRRNRSVLFFARFWQATA